MSDILLSDLAVLQAEEDALTESFSFFEDWAEKYRYLIDLGRSLPAFPESMKRPENQVSGCQSQVWFTASVVDGRVYFQAASDAAIVSGLVALLVRLYSGRFAQTILQAQPKFIEAVGLKEHLSPARSNGLFSMIQAMRNLAVICLDK